MSDNRIIELIEHAAREGIDLPMPAESIAALEDAGHVVDLVSGEIITDGADIEVTPTIIGEATKIVLDAEQAAEGADNAQV